MKLHFDLTKATPEFRKGFATALAFVHSGATVDTSHDSWVMYDAPAVHEDNVTYEYRNGAIYFCSFGVEE
jgi:hypothetical protein